MSLTGLRKVWLVVLTSDGSHPIHRMRSTDEFAAVGTAEQVGKLAESALGSPGFVELRVRPLGRESHALVDLDDESNAAGR